MSLSSPAALCPSSALPVRFLCAVLVRQLQATHTSGTGGAQARAAAFSVAGVLATVSGTKATATGVNETN